MTITATDAVRSFRGSICALVTPFREGAVDKDAFRALVEWHIAEGTHGLVPVGTTGESPTLSHDEHIEVVRLCVEVAKGRVPVIAGTGSNSTAEAIGFTKAAQQVGADGGLVVAPYYNKPNQEGLYAHFRAIHDATELPLVLYNIPGRSVIDIQPSTMGRLAELPRIVGVKDATADLTRVSAQRAQCGSDFVQLSGEDGTALAFNAHGGQGCISVTANVAPGPCAQFQEAMLAGDYAKALEFQDRLFPLHRTLFQEPNPAPAKAALDMLGKARDEVRLPLVPMSAEGREALRGAMEHAGLL